MLCTFGRVIVSAIAVHPEKAFSPTDVTELKSLPNEPVNPLKDSPPIVSAFGKPAFIVHVAFLKALPPMVTAFGKPAERLQVAFWKAPPPMVIAFGKPVGMAQVALSKA